MLGGPIDYLKGSLEPGDPGEEEKFEREKLRKKAVEKSKKSKTNDFTYVRLELIWVVPY